LSQRLPGTSKDGWKNFVLRLIEVNGFHCSLMAPISSPLFLGLDLSTQQLKAVLLDKDSEIVHEAAVHFDRDLPHHGTTNGATRGPDEREVTSPVQMWLEAIDLLCQRLKDGQVDFGSIAAISGAGQVCDLPKSTCQI